MSIHEARKFVAENRPVCLWLVRALSHRAAFVKAPHPFKNLEFLTDQELTDHNLVLLLWYMSYTNHWNDRTVKQFLKHMNNVRSDYKAMSLTKLDTIDESVKYDLRDYTFSLEHCPMTCQAGLETSNESLNNNPLLESEIHCDPARNLVKYIERHGEEERSELIYRTAYFLTNGGNGLTTVYDMLGAAIDIIEDSDCISPRASIYYNRRLQTMMMFEYHRRLVAELNSGLSTSEVQSLTIDQAIDDVLREEEEEDVPDLQPQMGFEWMQSNEGTADNPEPEVGTKWIDSKGREIPNKDRKPMFKATAQPSRIQPYCRQLTNAENIRSLNEQFLGFNQPSRK